MSTGTQLLMVHSSIVPTFQHQAVLTLKMEVLCSSEIMVTIYHSTQHNIPEDRMSKYIYYQIRVSHTFLKQISIHDKLERQK